MGCQPSKQNNDDIAEIQSNSSNFQLSPTQLICQDRGPIFDLYHFSTMISRSNYSIVRKAVNRSSRQQRICKIIPLINKKYLKVISQVEYLKKIDHPNIVQIIQYFLEPSLVYIILEDIPGDKLLASLAGKEFSLQTLKQIFLQLLSAVKYLHSKYICHRAITPDNILLYWVKQTAYLKIIDFSQAIALDCPNPSQVLISKRDIHIDSIDSRKSDKVDIFDCGLIFWSMLSGVKIKQSWLINLQDNLTKNLQNKKIKTEIKQDLKMLILSMLNSNPSKRPTIVECIEHKFFSHFHKKNGIKSQTFKNLIFIPINSIYQNQLFQFLRMYASLTMSSPLDKAELTTEFNNLDINKDGQIDLSQLIEGIQNTYNLDDKTAEKYAQDVFKRLDKNNDGTLDYSEYVLGTINLTKLISGQFLEKMFRQIDHNNDGQIQQKQLLDMLGDSITVSRNLIGKGTINYKKFVDIMNELVKSSQNQSQKSLKIIKQAHKPTISAKSIKIQQYDSQLQNSIKIETKVTETNLNKQNIPL